MPGLPPFARLDALLQDGVSGGVFPGAALVVAADDGAVVWERAVGVARRDRPGALVTLDTRFDLASLTKVLSTTALVMLAVDEGRLDLDAPLGTFLPGLPDPLARVTAWNCLTHSTGLPAWRPLFEVARWAGRRDVAPADREADRRAIRRALAATPLEGRPGERSVYSDLGFMLLDWVLETTLGERLDRAVARRLHEPLGLGHTGFVDLDAPGPEPGPCAATEDCAWRGRLLVGEVHDQNTAAMGGVSGQAGLFSTAREVHRIVRALHRAFRGEASGPFRPATVRRFWSACGVPGSSFRLGWDGPSPTGYTSAGRRIGPDAVGHLGFTGGSIWIAPEAGHWTILLSHRIHPTVENRRIQAFRPRLHDLVVAELRR